MNRVNYLYVYFTTMIFSLILSSKVNLKASGREIIELARYYNQKGAYYNAITEMMRYQYLYPKGGYYPLSLLIMGEAYYRGGNYYKATESMIDCYEETRDSPEGERALFTLGYIRIMMGSPFFAYRTYQEYQYIYKDGRYREKVSANICFALALMDDLGSAIRGIEDYKKSYPNGNYLESVSELQSLIENAINRPKKNLWTSLLGSILIPGFGHFYTGKYDIGLFSFFTNAILLYMFYDGYRDNSKLRMLLFGLAEFSFYQYSLYFALNNVHEYNSRDNFFKSVTVGINKEF